MSARRSLTRGIGELLRLLDPGLSDLVRTPQIHSEQVRQRKQHRQLIVVLHQPLVPRFDEAKLTLDEPEWVFNLGSDAGLESFKLDNGLVLARTLFERFDLAWAFGNGPFDLYPSQLLTLGCPLVTGITKHKFLLPVQQIAGLIEVVLIGRGGCQAMGQAAFGIDADMGLHAKVPLVALLGLVHLGVALLALVFGRTGGLDDSGINQGPLSHHDAGVREPLIDGLEELASQLVLLQPMAEVHDGGTVRDSLVEGKLGKEAHGGNLVERVLHRSVTEVVPLLDAVDTQHGLQRIGATTIAGLGINGLNHGQHS